jgi:hypothetical protein
MSCLLIGRWSRLVMRGIEGIEAVASYAPITTQSH